MEEDNNTRGWSAFRVILWAAIMSDIGEAVICIMAIKMCSELPLVAMERAMQRLENSNGSRGRSGEFEQKSAPVSIGLKELTDRFAMLEAFGMPRSYRIVGRLVLWFALWAIVLSLVTCYFWVCHTIIIIPAGLIVGFFVLISALLIAVFIMAVRFARNWT